MRSIKALFKIVIPTLLIVTFASFFFYFSSQAAALTAVYVYMNRIQAGLTTGVTYVIAVAPASNFSTAGTLKIEFPDAQDTNWCRTVGALTVAGVASSTADQTSGNWDIDLALPGTLTATCTQGSAGTSDTITVSGLTALTADTTYGVQISGNTGVLGTTATANQHDVTVTVTQGATIDSKTFKISLVTSDSVVVSATVSESPSVNCVIGSSSVSLGTLYPGGTFATGTHTISTTATSGYYWAAYGTGDGSSDAGLYKVPASPYLIPSTGSTTVDLNPANSQGFGLVLTQPSGASVPANFLAGTNGVFGALDRLPAGARMILSKTAAGTGEASTVTYGARASTSAIAGSYTETVTFICGGYY